MPNLQAPPKWWPACRPAKPSGTEWNDRGALPPLPPRGPVAHVATGGYIGAMVSTGIRNLKNNLSRYLRRVMQGERILVTDRGRVVAELRPPEGVAGIADAATRYRQLVEQGVVRLAREEGDPLAGWPNLKLPRGTGAQLVDADRGEG